MIPRSKPPTAIGTAAQSASESRSKSIPMGRKRLPNCYPAMSSSLRLGARGGSCFGPVVMRFVGGAFISQPAESQRRRVPDVPENNCFDHDKHDVVDERQSI